MQISNNIVAWDDVPQVQVVIDADSVDYTIPTGAPQRFTRLKVSGP